MPDTYIRFSDLKDSHPSPIDGANDLLAIAHKDTQSATGYTSMSVTPNSLGAHAVEDQTFTNLKTTNKTVEGSINESISNFANDYSASSTYDVDDCVLYAGKLYKCITAITVAEAWTPAHWTQIKAVDVGSGGGGNANIWEGTQDEYDAIVTKDPDTVYFITDTNGDGQQFQPIIYSEEEREIGVWTDGKPLYEKTFSLQSQLVCTSNSWTDTTISNTTIANIIDVKCLNSDGTIYECVGVNRNAGSGYIQILNTRNTTIAVNTIILCYTKTTDIAGSGTWTPQGVPAVHYSTDEYIVGTWTDGSTVYEKVCTGTTSTSTSQVLASGVDKIISMSGHAGTYALPAVQLDSNRKYIIVLLGEAAHEAKLFTEGSNYNGLTYEVVLRYTKSSS